jgi:hypothetical protein
MQRFFNAQPTGNIREERRAAVEARRAAQASNNDPQVDAINRIVDSVHPTFQNASRNEVPMDTGNNDVYTTPPTSPR